MNKRYFCRCNSLWNDKRTIRSYDWLFRNLNFPQTAQGIVGANGLEERKKERRNEKPGES